MKRALIALVAAGFVVAAISVARANSGENEPRHHRSAVASEAARQAEQVLRAQEELRKNVEEYADGRTHTLVVAIREERPGKVWILGKVDGKAVCVTPPGNAPTYVHVTPLRDDLPLATEVAPVEVTLLKNGACQAKVELIVPQRDGYQVTVVTANRRNSFGGVKVAHARAPQKVTILV